MLRRLMTLGELNLYNYSGGMPALYGSREMNGKECRVNGKALGKAEKANGIPYKVAGISRDLVQVRCPLPAEPCLWPCLCMGYTCMLSQPTRASPRNHWQG